jgi:hypothetical protein
VEPAFVGQPPHIAVEGGICFVTFAGDAAPRYAMPAHVLRRLCQAGQVRLAEWEAGERKRTPIVPLRQPAGKPVNR